MNRRARLATVPPLLWALAGCGGWQSILDSRSPGAAEIQWLWWFAFVSIGILTAVVFVGMAFAIQRARRRSASGEGARVSPREQAFVLLAGAAGPGLYLVGFLVVSVRVGTVVSEPPGGEPDLTIEVVAHQFWWEVHYPDDELVTANEIHIPAGEPVEVRVTSADVIHSFWVPQIQPGKIDMNPGRTNETWLLAEEPGTYRGQCTEFCGVQHALMSLVVVASPRQDFDAWLAARRDPPPEPTDTVALRGREIFLEAGCAACHAIEGVSRPTFAGTPGPDLTDLASRSTLGALTVPNDRDHLTDWIRNPHDFKPGVRMPPSPLDDEALEALVIYLETLQ